MDAANKIVDLIRDYNEMENDPSNLHILMDMRKDLTIAFFDLTKEFGDASSNSIILEKTYESKMRFWKAKRLKEKGNVAETTVYARANYTKYYRDVMDAKALVKKIEPLIDGAKEVLTEMNQRISQYKEEFKQTMVGNGH